MFATVDIATLRATHSAKWNKFPNDVLAAWVADMDFPIAAPIADALHHLVAADDHRYPDHALRPQLIELFAQRMAARHALHVDPDLVVMVTDVVQALNTAVFAFSEPGDSVVVLTPIYPPFLDAVTVQRRTLIDHRMQLTNGRYAFDIDMLRDQLRGYRGPGRARLLLLCQPHNPVGRVFTVDELRQLAALAHEFDLTIVSDEIHSDLVFAPHRHVSTASVDMATAARTITLNSASKSFNLAGLRCAFMAFGSASLLDQLQRAVPTKLLGAVSTTGMVATQAAWTEADPWLDACLGYLHANRQFITAALARDVPRIGHVPPEATYLHWLDLRALVPTGSTAGDLLLTGARVALNDGPTFGTGLDGYARLNTATSRAILTEIVSRLVEFAGLRA